MIALAASFCLGFGENSRGTLLMYNALHVCLVVGQTALQVGLAHGHRLCLYELSPLPSQATVSYMTWGKCVKYYMFQTLLCQTKLVLSDS